MTTGTNHKGAEEFVLYCPECDGLIAREINNAFIFENEGGQFVLLWERDSFKTHPFYIVGIL